MSEVIGGLIGIFGGLIGGGIGWWFGRKQLKKRRGLDERYYMIREKARAASWYATIIAIYVFFILRLFNVVTSLAMVLALLIAVQLASWAFFVFYYEKKY